MRSLLIVVFVSFVVLTTRATEARNAKPGPASATAKTKTASTSKRPAKPAKQTATKTAAKAKPTKRKPAPADDVAIRDDDAPAPARAEPTPDVAKKSTRAVPQALDNETPSTHKKR